MKNQYIFTLLLILLFVSPLIGQQRVEQYQAERERELRAPNRFLNQQSIDRLDVLGRYYRRAFEQQAIDQAAALRRGVAGGLSRSEDAAQFTFLQDGPIDPAKYIVGPNDLFSVGVWGEIPFTYTVYVNPEGSLHIPTVGVIHAAGKTLQEVRREITDALRGQYLTGDISVSLEQTRMFTVHIAGNIRRPGAYPVSAVQRVDKLLALAHIPDEHEFQRIQSRYLDDPERPQYYQHDEMLPIFQEREPSLRNIILQRKTGDAVHVDLVRYYATGNTDYNPYLLDGDRIIVRPEDMRSNTVSVYGGVRLPGRFEFHPNDSLNLMLEIAQGFTENAIRDSIEVIRFGEEGDTFEKIVVNGNDVVRGTANLALQKNDRVIVMERAEVRREHTVFVQGEVHYAGAFPIIDGGTKLSAIIEAAGGFTRYAAIAEAKIFRRTAGEQWDPLLSNPDYQRLRDMRLSRLNVEGREYFNYEAAIRRDFVSVDFRKLFLENDSSADVTLQDGDVIIIPKRSNTVYVFGQVANPGYIDMQPGWHAENYIERAGGFSEAARKRGIRVIKAGTKEWIKPGKTAIEVGDAIWVPRIRDRDFGYYFAFVRDVLQITTGLVTIYFLIQSVSDSGD
jgi:protein involved in polysaccharide export with SLBB domain